MVKCIQWIILLSVFSGQIALAAPPQTLDYQGYLANSSGVPLTGTQSVEINLYSAASGGTVLWTQSSSPTLTNGRFTVVLDGSGGNAFPAGLFDQQLYVGLTVGTDAEMTPRQSLTSVPSAFEAINSDTVDGMQANEIIDAASDEVRTPISSVPFTITSSGSYYLTGNLTQPLLGGGGGGIDINADNVTIDLMGFTIFGASTNPLTGVTSNVDDHGIQFSGRSGVTIKNGVISGFGRAGIYSGFTGAQGNSVEDIKALGNGALSSTASYSGIILVSTSSRIERCSAVNNGGYGLFVGTSGIIKDSSASENGRFGIYGWSGATLTNNTAYNNQGGIYGGSGATLTHNTAYRNQGWGVHADGSNTVIGNTVYQNNLSSTDFSGGLRVGNDSLVKNNTVDGNRHTGIRVFSADNMLKDNHVADTININGGGVADGFCFEFDSSDNAAVGNSATGCTTEFGGAGWPSAVNRDNDAW